MSDNLKEREAFEAWFSEQGKWPAAVDRRGDGYILAAAQSAWVAWQARAAIDADRVSRDVPTDLAAVLLELDTPIAGLLGSHSGKFIPSTSKDSKEFDAFESAIPLVRWADHERTCRKIAALAAAPQPQPVAQPVQEQPSERCPNCDDTGDVHSFDGEWRGVCHCPAGQTINAQPKPANQQKE